MSQTPEEFFYKHAGYSYDPATETEEQGKRRGAAQLATAERFAAALGLSYSWEDDWGLNTSHADYFCADAYPDGEPNTCEWVQVWGGWGTVVGAMGCVDDAFLVVEKGTERGWVRFVMGNDPDEVVCDYTIKLEGALAPMFERWNA